MLHYFLVVVLSYQPPFIEFLDSFQLRVEVDLIFNYFTIIEIAITLSIKDFRYDYYKNHVLFSTGAATKLVA